MRRTALAALVLAGMATLAATTSPAARVRANDTVVNFDNLVAGGPPNGGVTVSSQYAALGVTFNNVSAIDYSKGSFAIPGFAHSGSIAVEQCVGAEFCTTPVSATFATPQQKVHVWVGFSAALSQPVQVQLKALNGAGSIVGTATATLPASSTPTPIRTPLEIDVGSASVTQVQVGIPASFNNNLAVDDLEFSIPAPPPPTCPATAVPTVRIDQPADGATVRANAFTLQGNVAGNGAPMTGATLRVVGKTTKTAALFPSPIGSGGGSFGPSSFADLLSVGKQQVFVSATNCKGTGTASAAVFLCTPDAPANGSATVSTYAELKAAVDGCKKDIHVTDGARIDLGSVGDERTGAPDYVLRLRDGVTLSGGRSPMVEGGLLYMSRHLRVQTHMLDLGSNTRVTGLRLRGYDEYVTDNPDNVSTDAIFIGASQDVVVDNNEIYGWPNAGVEVSNSLNTHATIGRIRISGNYIHNNVSCPGDGYGIVIGGSGFADIEGNVFNYDRHDIADDGKPGTGYVAQDNLVLASGPTCGGFYNQHFDMHGTNTGSSHQGGVGGQFVLIRRNTIRGAQHYGGHLGFGEKVRPAFQLRGTPTERAIFEDNAVAAHNEDDAVRIEDPLDRETLKRQHKLVVRDNRYDVDTSTQLAVGDFNGDGRADIFQATGAVWAYSPSGQREWQVLNESSLLLDRLAFGDFNGDGKADVFSQQGSSWRVSYGGVTPWQSLPAGSNIDMRKYYAFGDFDGDHKTDVFRANGSHWYISSGGATAWQEIGTSRFKVGDLRFGDFNGDGKTDVFSLANGQWSVSYGGRTAWTRLNRKLSGDLGELVFADFNGDGKTDVARGGNRRWEVSYGGTGAWRTLNRGALAPLSLTLLGDFTGDRRADALQHLVLKATVPPIQTTTRFKLSSGGDRPLQTWSEHDVN